MKLQELIDLAEEYGACTCSLLRVRRHHSLKSAAADEHAPYWAWWLRLHVPHRLSPKWLKKLENKALESEAMSYYFRLYADTLVSPELRRRAELRACRTQEGADRLRRGIDPGRLHPDTIKKLRKLLGDAYGR